MSNAEMIYELEMLRDYLIEMAVDMDAMAPTFEALRYSIELLGKEQKIKLMDGKEE